MRAETARRRGGAAAVCAALLSGAAAWALSGANASGELARVQPAPSQGVVGADVVWACRNADIEISCSAEGCAASDAFTPMDARFGPGPRISVCAYTGCWEGEAALMQVGETTAYLAADLPFSTSPDFTAAVSALVDASDAIAMVKVAGFAHPMSCARATPQR